MTTYNNNNNLELGCEVIASPPDNRPDILGDQKNHFLSISIASSCENSVVKYCIFVRMQSDEHRKS